VFTNRLDTTYKQLQAQIGVAFTSPASWDQRKANFQSKYKDNSQAYQQVLDRMQDDLAHAKAVLRGRYALFLQKQRAQLEEKERKAQEEEEERRRMEEERREEVRRKEEEERQRKEEEEKKAAEEREKAQREKELKENPPPVEQNAFDSAVQASPDHLGGSLNADQSVNSTTDELADFDTFISNLTNNNAADSTAMDLSTDAFSDPSTDVASLIPGIENFAKMAPTTTTSPAATTTATAGNITADTPFDFSGLPDMGGSGDNAAGDVMDISGGDDTFADIFGDMGFTDDANMGEGGNGDNANGDNDFDSWLNSMDP
jgi:hypothetical protein